MLLLGMLTLTILLVAGANQAPEARLVVDVTGCSSEACEDMLEEVQAADLSSFVIEGGR